MDKKYKRMKRFYDHTSKPLQELILCIRQNREASEGSVHCADIEGIDEKPGSANSFGCRTLGKIPKISPSPVATSPVVLR